MNWYTIIYLEVHVVVLFLFLIVRGYVHVHMSLHAITEDSVTQLITSLHSQKIKNK